MSEITLDFTAIGTHWIIQYKSEETIDARIKDRIALFEQNYSRFRGDSFVGQIAQESGMYRLPDDVEQLLAMYRKLYDLSGGKVTPLIGSILNEAGYDKDYSLTPKEIHKAEDWDAVMKYVPPFLITEKPVQLDFGGLGKGYLIDIVAALFKEYGILDFSINAGGDIAYSTTGKEAFRVGLEDPSDTTQIIGVAELMNRSITGSAGNRRAWKHFHHIIDPQSGVSPNHIAALWVVADTTLIADAMTTALFFMAPEVLQQHFSFEYAILSNDKSIKHSPNFPALFYTT